MTTTDDVREAFRGIDTVEFETSGLADGIRVTVPDDYAGELFRQIRINDFDAETKRLGDTLVSHIRAESSNTLADLFG